VRRQVGVRHIEDAAPGSRLALDAMDARPKRNGLTIEAKPGETGETCRLQQYARPDRSRCLEALKQAHIMTGAVQKRRSSEAGGAGTRNGNVKWVHGRAPLACVGKVAEYGDLRDSAR
jgi:hypothetical protein